MLARILALIATGCAVLSFGASAAGGATATTPFDVARLDAFEPQPNARFGNRMTSAGDLDGDGVGDVWISSYQWDQGPLSDAGRLWAVSGRTRALLYTIASPEPQGSTSPFAGFGWAISSLGDIDGDGVDDLVVGSVRHNATAAGIPCTPPAAGCNAEQGKVWAFSGAVGTPKTPLYELNNPEPQASGGFGGVSTAGDIVKADGTPGKDGITEVLVGAFLNDVPAGCGNALPIVGPCRKDEGQVFVFNGALRLPAGTPRLVRTLGTPPEDRYVDASGICNSPTAQHPTQQRCGALGEVAQGTGDVNGDGFDDQSGTAWTTGVTSPGGQTCLGLPFGQEVSDACNERQGRIYIYSGKDGSLLRKLDDPIPQTGALFGLQKVEAGAPGDIDGDGFADLYGNGFMQRGPSRDGSAPLIFEGQAWTFSGRTGQVLHKYTNPKPEAFGAFGYSMTQTDYNRDGRPDLFVGSFSGSYVFDGPSGELQKSFDVPPADREGQPPGNVNFGYSIAAPGDLNSDGEPDYVSAAPGLDVAGNRDDGPAYFFLSKVPPPDPLPLGQPPGLTPGPPMPPVMPPAAPVTRVGAQLQVQRAQLRKGRLRVLVRMTRLASGSVRLRIQGAGRTVSFSQPVSQGVVRVTRRLSGPQSRLSTGMLTVAYAGNARVRPESVRLRAASRLPGLVAKVTRISSGRLQVSGTITSSARGVVRLRLSYAAGGDRLKLLTYTTPIKRGRWALAQKLPATARQGGELSILYAGSARGPIAGAQIARRLTSGP